MNWKAIVVLSFDDGRKDLIKNVVPVLKEMSIPATFNITTGFVDGTLKSENRFCKNSSVDISDLQKLDRNLFEIAAHGDQHDNSLSDITVSVDKLRKWGLIENEVGFASPCHGLDEADDEEINNIAEKVGLRYVRVGTRFKRNLLSKISRGIACRLNCKLWFRKIYCQTLNDLNNGNKIFTCIPYNKNMSNKMLSEMVYSAEVSNKTVIFLFHSVLKDTDELYKDIENMDYLQFRFFCDYLREEREKGRIMIKKNIECVKI